MVRERKTKLAERIISLLLATVMMVSGTGFTALAADIVPEESAAEVETVSSEESADADLSEELATDADDNAAASDDEALSDAHVSGDAEMTEDTGESEDAADTADAEHTEDTADAEDTADTVDAEDAENTEAAEDEENAADEQVPQGDSTADVESEADWKAMFSGVIQTGNYAVDLLAVAQTQIGYTESTANFTVIDGQSYGYTRYGAWYGMPYSEWCAEFVSFCLNYAGIPASKMPREAKCTRWITALEAAGQYQKACTYHKLAVEEPEVEETTGKYYIDYVYGNNQLTGYYKYYIPSVGDLIFFDYEEDGESDHVGIVKEVVNDSEGKPIRIVTIEGNVGDAVKEQRYDFMDSTILGYGILPVNMPAQSFERTCGDVTVSVSAPEGALPSASKMEVAEAALEDVLSKLPAELRDSVTSIVAVDISFYDASGNEIEPEIPLRVSFRSDAIAEIEEASLIHVTDKGELSFCTILDDGAESKDTIAFESKDFSIYAVVGVVADVTEIAESENEPLLSDNELTGTTRRLLGVDPAGVRANSNRLSIADVTTDGPVTVDGQTIERIAIKWLTSSTGSDTAAGTDTLELTPTTDAVENQQFQFNFVITGEMDYEAGDVEIVLPAYIWKDRDGNEMGSLTLGIPEYPNSSQSFAWRREGDYIVITNTRTLSATSKVMIQGTFRDIVAHEVVSDQGSSPLWAVITLTTASGNAVSLASNTIEAKVHTTAEAASATKSALNTSTGEYYAWVTSVPSGIPDAFFGVLPAGSDREDYCYVRWYVTGTAVGNQLYSMELVDTASDESGCIMLGIQAANGRAYPSEDGKSASAQLLTNDFREISKGSTGQLAQSAYVWTAYPKSDLEEGIIYTFHNTATIRVTGTDSGETTSKSASAQVQLKLPTTYTFIKEWDDDDNAKGRRPENLYIYIYRDGRQWKTVKLHPDENGVWSYSWSDEGIDYVYDVYERLEDGRYVKSPNRVRLMRSADSITYGLVDVYYGANGVAYPLRWWYSLYEADYDTNTHTWTYINKYREGTIPEDYGLSKTATSYTDSKEVSTSDRAVKELLRGESVLLTYDLSGTATSLIQGAKEDEFFTIAMSDTGAMLRNERTGLETTDGMELTYVTLTPQSNYTYHATGIKDDEYRDYYTRSEAEHTGTSELYALIGDSSEWQLLATYDGTSVELQDGFTSLTVDGATVYLPEGTAQIKVVAKTNKDSVTMSYSVGLTVHPTDEVIHIIEEAMDTYDYVLLQVYNYATMQSYLPNGEEWEHSNDFARAYLHGHVYRVSAWETKDFRFTEVDQDNRRVVLQTGATVTEQSNITSQSEYKEAIEEGAIPCVSGGTWYDLLPLGVTADLSTIKLSGGDILKDAYVIENYQGSGREMVVIKAQFADHSRYVSDGYRNTQTVSFTSYYSLEGYDKDTINLSNFRNVIAFESDDSWIGNVAGLTGEPDDPHAGNHRESLTYLGADADLMTDLDSERDDPSFVYAGAYLAYADEIDLMQVAGLSKNVSVSGSGLWSRGLDGEATVYESGLYSYLLSVTNEEDTTKEISGIVILDEIEGYVPVEESADYGDSQWKGTFRSVDVSQLRRIGVDPVVYYSTASDLDLSAFRYEDLDNAALWSVNPPEDLADVTAIAVDARNAAAADENGSTAFVLGAGKSLTVTINMQAPVDETLFHDPKDDPSTNDHAYNNFWTAQQGDSETVPEMTASKYTKVGIVPFDLTVTKVWSDGGNRDRIQPDSVTVHLYANGQDTGDSVTLSQENEWTAGFDHVQMYDESGRYITYAFVEDPVEGYTAFASRDAKDVRNVTLTNTHDPERVSITVEKTWEDDELDDGTYARPDAIRVYLYADGKNSGQTKVIRPDVNGNWTATFTDLYKYSDGEPIEYTVVEAAVEDFITTYPDSDEPGTLYINNRYYPYGDLSVTKEIVGATSVSEDQEFTFTLILTDKDGNTEQDSYAYTIYPADYDAETDTPAAGTIFSGGQFKLKAGERFEMKDLPSGTQYQVVEASAKGWTLTGSSNTTGSIVAGTEKAAVFTNTYSAAAAVGLTAQKTLTGHEMARYQFRFQVTAETDPDTILTMASNAADGSVVFSNFNYTNADHGKTFTYYISEVNRGKEGYTYDKNVVIADVTPTDNGNGTMSVAVTYYQAQTDADGNPIVDGDGRYVRGDALQNGAQFANEYHAEGELTLRAWKVLEGRTLTEGEFTFQLLDSDGNVLQTAANTADGSVVFQPIAYDETNVGETYYYFVRELSGEDETVVYTDSVCGYSVTVLDNDDGTLAFDQGFVDATERYIDCPDCGGTGLVAEEQPCETCGGTGRVWNPDWTPAESTDLPVLTNTLEDGSLSITKLTADAAEDDNAEFTFRVVLTGDKIEDGERDYTLTQVSEDNGGDPEPSAEPQTNPAPAKTAAPP